jgi:hypothetical protein
MNQFSLSINLMFPTASRPRTGGIDDHFIALDSYFENTTLTFKANPSIYGCGGY